MAKAKPKAAAAKAKTAVLAAQMKAKPKKPNPFELKGSKGHFDTIGRRLSGKKQNVIQARQEAVNRELYGILVQHFALEAGKSPLPVPSLDVLTRVLLELTPEVPYYAATVARARLGRMSEQLTAALGGATSSPWPPARVVLQLKLFSALFPTSDRRHPVLTPAALLVGNAAKKRRGGGGAGAAENGSGGEAAAAVAPPAPQQQQQQRDPDAFVRFAPGCLALGGNAAAELPPPPPALDLYGVLGMSSSDPRVGGEAFKLGLLRVALCGVRRAAAVAAESGLVCFEQLFGPLRSVVSELSRIDGRLPEELRNLRASVQQQLVAASATCVASRRPLAHPGRARSGGAAAGVIPAAAVREFNPRFEDGFVSGRDYDPDRQRAEARRLKRALVKERRGAIRELRRDSVFMAEERDRETARVDAERLQSERQFYSELQRQEADLRSGGQGGMNPHLKKRKGGGGKR
ncbi:hypothetical protein PLESTF_000821600 [Pleodorina starrii]|nr:hypothetical protein PLESTF_000821600 [Pleodorina starrii]